MRVSYSEPTIDRVQEQRNRLVALEAARNVCGGIADPAQVAKVANVIQRDMRYLTAPGELRDLASRAQRLGLALDLNYAIQNDELVRKYVVLPVSALQKSDMPAVYSRTQAQRDTSLVFSGIAEVRDFLDRREEQA